MWVLAAFLAIPVIEIALFIKVGGVIGLWPTLGLVLLSAIAGSWLVRRQGAEAMVRLRGALNAFEDPTGPLAEGALTVLAGLLLMIPGFFTDLLAAPLLLPPVRAGLLRFLAARLQVDRFGIGAAPPRRDPWRPDVIDGEFHEIGPADESGEGPARRPSGWTRH